MQTSLLFVISIAPASLALAEVLLLADARIIDPSPDRGVMRAILDEPVDDEFIALMKKASAVYAPTHILYEAGAKQPAMAQRYRGGAALNLANGNAELPDAFARELGDRIRFDSTDTGIEWHDWGVTLQVETNGQVDHLYADGAVIAIPFTALRKITIAPELPAGRQKIIDELPYTQIAQNYLQTRTRFREKDAQARGDRDTGRDGLNT